MKRIKILNPMRGRNERTFRPFLRAAPELRTVGLQLVNDDAYDYLAVGPEEFMFPHLPHAQSVERGIERIKALKGPVLLFDGSPSSSLWGVYEVFVESGAQFLFKNQLVSRERYRTPTPLGRWYLQDYGGYEVRYDIPDEIWSRIKLSGWNLGSVDTFYSNVVEPGTERTYDLNFRFTGAGPTDEFGAPIGEYLRTVHRMTKAEIDALPEQISVIQGSVGFDEYVSDIMSSAVCVSVFEEGELVGRDFEVPQYGSMLVRADLAALHTVPNIFLSGVTCLMYAADMKDFIATVEQACSMPPAARRKLTENFRERYREAYSSQRLATYWENLLKDILSQ